MAEAEVFAVHEHGLWPDFLEQICCRLPDVAPIRFKGGEQVLLAQRGRAEVVFQRLRGNGALHRHTVCFCRKRNDEIARAILGAFIGK